MKALVLHGPGNLKFSDSYPMPILKKGWALVKVKYSGICGSDLPRTFVTGTYHHPLICGHEFMGVVERPAKGSGKFRKGDRVAVLPLIPCGKCQQCKEKEYFHCANYNFLGSRTDGGFAEYCTVPEKNLFLLPKGIDDRSGAFIEPISVALHVVRRSDFKKGKRALVFGAGAIGLLVAVWLKIMGVKEIVIVDIRHESIEIAKKLGFKSSVNVNSEEFKKLNGYDFCYECAGSNYALICAIEKTKRKGRITIVGRETNETRIPVSIFEKFMRKEIDLKGCWGYNNTGEEKFIYNSLGKFNIMPMITSEIPLEKGEETIKKMYNKDMYFCKVLFRI